MSRFLVFHLATCGPHFCLAVNLRGSFANLCLLQFYIKLGEWQRNKSDIKKNMVNLHYLKKGPKWHHRWFLNFLESFIVKSLKMFFIFLTSILQKVLCLLVLKLWIKKILTNNTAWFSNVNIFFFNDFFGLWCNTMMLKCQKSCQKTAFTRYS